jgi:hypothetical protein
VSITSVGTPSPVQNNTGDPITASWGTGQTRAAGNLLVALVSGFSSGGAAATTLFSGTGWTKLDEGVGPNVPAGCVAAIWTKTAVGSDAAPGFSTSVSGFHQGDMVTLYELNDSGGGTPVVDTNGNNTGTNANPLAGTTSGNVSGSGEYAVAVATNGIGTVSSTNTWGTPGSWTNFSHDVPSTYANGFGHWVVGQQSGPSSGSTLTYNPTWSFNANSPTTAAVVVAVFKSNVVALSDSDAGSGAETAIIYLTSAETGSFAEAVGGNFLSSSDAGTGVEGTPTIAFTASGDYADGGTFTDAGNTGSPTDQDSFIGVDGGETITVAGAETTAGADTGSPAVATAITSADTGAGVDAGSVVVSGLTSTGPQFPLIFQMQPVGSGAHASSDMGTFTESQSITAHLSSSDSGRFFESRQLVTQGGNPVPPPQIPALHVEGFSITHAGILVPGTSTELAVLYGVRSAQISPQWITTLTHQDDWVTNVWNAPGTVGVQIQAGFIPFDVLDAMGFGPVTANSFLLDETGDTLYDETGTDALEDESGAVAVGTVTSVGTPTPAENRTGDPITGIWGPGQNRINGNLLVALVTGFGQGGTPGPTTLFSGTGWTKAREISTNYLTASVWTKKATGADPPPSFVCNVSGLHQSDSCTLYELNDSSGATPVLDTAGTAMGTSGNPLSITSDGTVARSGEYALGLSLNCNNIVTAPNTWGTVSGWTNAYVDTTSWFEHWVIGTQSGPAAGASLTYDPHYNYSSNSPTAECGLVAVFSSGITGSPPSGTGGSQGAGGSAGAIPMFRQHVVPQFPLILRASAKDAAGNLRTIQFVAYACQFSPIVFDGPQYKNGLTVSYNATLLLSSVDEGGNTLPDRAYGRLMTMPQGVSGLEPVVPGPQEFVNDDDFGQFINETSLAGPMGGPFHVSDADHGAFTEGQRIGTGVQHLTDTDAGHFTDAGSAGVLVHKSSADTGGSGGPSSGSLFNLIGATVQNAPTPEYGGATDRLIVAQTLNTYLSAGLATPLAPATVIQKWYFNVGSYPTTMDADMTELHSVGCKFLISYKPDLAPYTTAHDNAFLASMNALKGLGVDFQVVIWQEANDPGFSPFTAAEYIDYFNHYAPIVHAAGKLAVYDPGAHPTSAAAFYPGDALVDWVVSDHYCAHFGSSVSGGFTAVEALANNANPPKPLGLGEWGTAINPADQPTQTEWEGFTQQILTTFASRPAAGKANAWILGFNTAHRPTGVNVIQNSVHVAPASAGGTIQNIATWSFPAPGVLEVVGDISYYPCTTASAKNPSAAKAAILPYRVAIKMGGSWAYVNYADVDTNATGQRFTGCTFDPVAGNATGVVPTNAWVVDYKTPAYQAIVTQLSPPPSTGSGEHGSVVAFTPGSQPVAQHIGAVSAPANSCPSSVNDWLTHGNPTIGPLTSDNIYYSGTQALTTYAAGHLGADNESNLPAGTVPFISIKDAQVPNVASYVASVPSNVLLYITYFQGAESSYPAGNFAQFIANFKAFSSAVRAVGKANVKVFQACAGGPYGTSGSSAAAGSWVVPPAYVDAYTVQIRQGPVASTNWSSAGLSNSPAWLKWVSIFAPLGRQLGISEYAILNSVDPTVGNTRITADCAYLRSAFPPTATSGQVSPFPLLVWSYAWNNCVGGTFDATNGSQFTDATNVATWQQIANGTL